MTQLIDHPVAWTRSAQVRAQARQATNSGAVIGATTADLIPTPVGPAATSYERRVLAYRRQAITTRWYWVGLSAISLFVAIAVTFGADFTG